MTDRQTIGGLKVASELANLIENEILPGTGISASDFWSGFESALNDLAPVNKALLKKRDQMQAQIDTWHRDNKASAIDLVTYKTFLTDIGYLVPEGDDFSITTLNVDSEISSIAGPQLVVPVMNARFALNAANARWGSLYDALYGTDVISLTGDTAKGRGYNEARGAAVIKKAAEFLDQACPLAGGSHVTVRSYDVKGEMLSVTLTDGTVTGLKDPAQFIGSSSHGDVSGILLKNNGLHIDIQIDRNDAIGKASPAGVKDLVLESALTTIQDCEDSVAAVDAGDKCVVYRNWLGLMKGDLSESFEKGGKTLTRRLVEDR
ncbi:MAG: malate synthase G, partial [Cohaesibacteraceae bacterium]|nr:malate synthase G [Cohaesibacteraceae bacterium]